MLLVSRKYGDFARDFKLIQRIVCKTSNKDSIARKNSYNFKTYDWVKPNLRNDGWLNGLNPSNLFLRNLSTIQTKSHKSVSLVSKDEFDYFMQIFPEVVQDLIYTNHLADIPEIRKHFTNLLEYNVPNGKKYRGLAVVSAYKLLEKPENLTPENIRLANILGWCVETLASFIMVMDDVMDQGEIRRGRKCWYKIEDIGLGAVNDSVILLNSVYSVLRKHFSKHPCYIPIIDIVHKSALNTSIGQALDMLSAHNGKPNFDMFTMKTFSTIAKLKTSSGCFIFPVALAMYLANYSDPEQHRLAETILLQMGELYQIQDDFLDAFGNPEVIEKIGTDIKEGKCTWLAVDTLERANSMQRQIMKEHYGRNNAESINIIRNLYEEMNFRKRFAECEEDWYNRIRIWIQQVPKELPQDVFFKMLAQIYKRNR